MATLTVEDVIPLLSNSYECSALRKFFQFSSTHVRAS